MDCILFKCNNFLNVFVFCLVFVINGLIFLVIKIFVFFCCVLSVVSSSLGFVVIVMMLFIIFGVVGGFVDEGKIKKLMGVCGWSGIYGFGFVRIGVGMVVESEVMVKVRESERRR